MALNSTDVNEVSFSVDRKGYNVDEVDEFLEQVAASLDELMGEIEALNEALHRAEQNAAPATEDGAVVTVGDLEARDNRIAELEAQVAEHRADDSAIAQALIIAQRSADEIIANANRTAAGTQQDAQDEAQRILDKANAEKQRIIDDINRLEEDRESARARYADMLNDFIADSQSILVELDSGARRTAAHGSFATAEIPAANSATATYTTPTVSPVVAAPAAPKPSKVEKDFSGFGDTDDGFELDDID